MVGNVKNILVMKSQFLVNKNLQSTTYSLYPRGLGTWKIRSYVFGFDQRDQWRDLWHFCGATNNFRHDIFPVFTLLSFFSCCFITSFFFFFYCLRGNSNTTWVGATGNNNNLEKYAHHCRLQHKPYIVHCCNLLLYAGGKS